MTLPNYVFISIIYYHKIPWKDEINPVGSDNRKYRKYKYLLWIPAPIYFRTNTMGVLGTIAIKRLLNNCDILIFYSGLKHEAVMLHKYVIYSRVIFPQTHTCKYIFCVFTNVPNTKYINRLETYE